MLLVKIPSSRWYLTLALKAGFCYMKKDIFMHRYHVVDIAVTGSYAVWGNVLFKKTVLWHPFGLKKTVCDIVSGDVGFSFSFFLKFLFSFLSSLSLPFFLWPNLPLLTLTWAWIAEDINDFLEPRIDSENSQLELGKRTGATCKFFMAWNQASKPTANTGCWS